MRQTRAGDRRWRPALLSGLVLPGLGQLTQRRWAPALAFAGSTIVLLAVVLRRVWVEVHARLPADPDELASRLLDDPGWPLRLAAEIQRDNAGLFLALTVALVVLWLASVWDAWRAGGPARP